MLQAHQVYDACVGCMQRSNSQFECIRNVNVVICKYYNNKVYIHRILMRYFIAFHPQLTEDANEMSNAKCVPSKQS